MAFLPLAGQCWIITIPYLQCHTRINLVMSLNLTWPHRVEVDNLMALHKIHTMRSSSVWAHGWWRRVVPFISLSEGPWILWNKWSNQKQPNLTRVQGLKQTKVPYHTEFTLTPIELCSAKPRVWHYQLSLFYSCTLQHSDKLIIVKRRYAGKNKSVPTQEIKHFQYKKY